MHRLTSLFLFLVPVFLICTAWAQDRTSSDTATCSFDADRELTVEYQRVSFNLKKPVFGHEIPYGKAWAPGGKPLTLFTNSAERSAERCFPSVPIQCLCCSRRSSGL